MVTIERINRGYEIKNCNMILSNGLTDNKPITHYIETQDEFLKNIEKLCNSIGEENIISIQFFNGERNEIDNCIISYKE